jgi:mRNA interferase RelE/StbE
VPYRLIIKRQAKQKLKSLSVNERVRITDKIDQLAVNPNDPALDVKSMAGAEPDLYRLRVGSWRIIFFRFVSDRVISIEKIGARGDVYK